MIKIEYVNELFASIDTDSYTKRKLYKFFSVEEPSYFFVPAFKLGYWDGKRNLYTGGNFVHVGLIPYIKLFCEKYNIEYMNINNVLDEDNISLEILEDSIKNYNIPLEIRDYQKSTVLQCMKYKKCAVSSPTSSGKSLMIYILTRLMCQRKRKNNKILIIVPSKILVKQMYEDFKSYSKNDDNWNVEEQCTRISSDFKKDFDKSVIITTYQSITDYDENFFKHFEGVILDECHGAQSYGDKKAKCLHKILDKCINSYWRYGFTGTFPDQTLYKLTLLKYFVNKYESTDYGELLKNNWISNFQVNAIKLNHYVNKNGQVYRDEMNYIYEDKYRNDFLLKLLDKNQNNQLVLFKEVEKHAKKIQRLLENDERFDNRKIILLDSDSKASERDEVKELIKNNNNIILLATYKLLGTGWSVNNLHHIIFAAPLKSKQPLLQSIGRGLRLLNNEKNCKIWDIIDKFLYYNVLWKQWLERQSHYIEAGFKLKLVEIDDTIKNNKNKSYIDRNSDDLF